MLLQWMPSTLFHEPQIDLQNKKLNIEKTNFARKLSTGWPYSTLILKYKPILAF